jgi:hypothetical protein
MQWITILVYSAALVGGAAAGPAQAAPVKAPALPGTVHQALAAQPAALFPKRLAGWLLAGTPKELAGPAQADAAALREYGLVRALVAEYKRSGETLRVRALCFQDATGAFGAYSLYRQNGWPRVDIGMGASSNQQRVLFWTGNTVVDANFSRLGPASVAELRELARRLPIPQGGKALAPPVLANLPQAHLDGQTTHYALGPAGYLGSGGVLPPELVGFDQGAEVVTANYTLRSGLATLTIIDYPTPQAAAVGESHIRAYLKAGNRQQAWPKPLQDSNSASLEVQRSGPLVALVSGDAIPQESQHLLAMVHYDANLTSVPLPAESEVSKTGRFLVGVSLLVLVGASMAILLGFFLGGFRALYRVARGKPASSVYDTEFISLHLQDRNK